MRIEPEWDKIDRFFDLMIAAARFNDTERVKVLDTLARRKLCNRDYQLLRSDINYRAQMQHPVNVA